MKPNHKNIVDVIQHLQGSVSLAHIGVKYVYFSKLVFFENNWYIIEFPSPSLRGRSWDQIFVRRCWCISKGNNILLRSIHQGGPCWIPDIVFQKFIDLNDQYEIHHSKTRQESQLILLIYSGVVWFIYCKWFNIVYREARSKII